MSASSRRLVVLLTVLTSSVLTATSRSQEPESKPSRLRVLSYNIHHGEGTDSRLDLARIASVIESAEPDIVALQEVDRETARTGSVDQAAVLARLTELNVVFGGNFAFLGGDYGNAVLSRFPIAAHENHALPSFDDGEPRGVLEVTIDPQDGPPLRFFCTHLDHRRDDRERIASARFINRLVEATPERAAILAGDLNARPDSAVLRIFDDAWSLTNREPLPTSPAGRPRVQIDYVLVKPADRWRVVEVRVLDEPVASDHRPILAVLERVEASDSGTD